MDLRRLEECCKENNRKLGDNYRKLEARYRGGKENNDKLRSSKKRTVNYYNIGRREGKINDMIVGI